MAKLSAAVCLAGAALIATTTTTVVDAARSRTNLGNVAVAAASAEALLQKARPYRKAAGGGDASSSTSRHQHHNHHHRRRLDENYAFDGSYSLKFSQCIDMKLLDQDLFDEDVIEYTEAGQITSTASYALFHICQNDDCYYESEDDLYIVDLATYVKNVAGYHANVKSSYCDACDAYYYNYCAGGGGGGDDGYAGDDNYYQRRTTSYIDCDQCQAYGCLNNGDDDGGGQQQQQNNNDGDNSVAELIEDIAGCLNTGLNWNDDQLYVGFMCSPYSGDGVELAIFLDNECTVYTSLKAFSDIPSWYIYNDADMFTEAETYIKYAFTETTPCLYEEFGDPSYQNNYGGGDDAAAAAADDDGGNNAAVNEFCANIFEEAPVAFNSCALSDDQANNNDDNEGNNNNQNDDDTYSWYDYDMNYDDSQNLDEVCTVLQQMEGEYYYQYDEENSGTWNDHSGWGSGSSNSRNNKKNWTTNKGSWGFLDGVGKPGFSTTGLAVTMYVMISVFLLVGILFVVGVYEKKRRDRLNSMEEEEDPYYEGGRQERGSRRSRSRTRGSHSQGSGRLV